MHDMKPWQCGHGHTMGVVRRNGTGIRQLFLYRNAVQDGRGCEIVEVDVIAVIEGYVTDVRCSLCGDIRTWIPGEEALREMLEKMRRNYGSH